MPDPDRERRAAAFAHVESQVDVLARRLKRSLVHRAADLGDGVSPAGYLVVRHLLAEGPARQVDLVGRFDSEKGAISRVVQQLVDAGLAERSRDPADGRAQLITATPHAARCHTEVDDRRRDEYRARLEPLATDDLVQLAALLERYNDAVERPGVAPPG